MSYKLQL